MEALEKDDSFDIYDDVPVHIVKRRTFGGELYYLVRWRVCGVSWIAAEDFAYPGLVTDFEVSRMRKPEEPPAPKVPQHNYSRARYAATTTTGPVCWGHGGYTDFPWHEEGDSLKWTLTCGFGSYYTVTRIETWVNQTRRRNFQVSWADASK